MNPRPIVAADPIHRPFDLLRCRNCGLVQAHPRYSDAQLGGLYADDYYVFADDDGRRWARAVQQYVVHLAASEPAGGGRLLDVGCALGHFVALAQARGWSVVGIDVSESAVGRAREAFELDGRCGTLGELKDRLGSFDAVFLGDVIEHVPEPRSFLQDVLDVLRPGGTVHVDTPNWSSPWRRFGRSRWLGLNRFHINLFDARSLTRLLADVGFETVRCGSYTHVGYESWAARPEIQAAVRRLPAALSWRFNRFADRRAGRRHWSSLREACPRTLDEAVWLSHAIGGAGHVWQGGTTGDNLAVAARRRS